MKSRFFLLCTLFWMQFGAARLSAEEKPIRLAVDLIDGSRVTGISRNNSIRIKTDFGELDVLLRLIDHVRWKEDREQVVLEFPNGDRLTGAVIPEDVQLVTLFGDAKISMQHMVKLKPLSPQASGIPSLDGLIVHFAFDEEPIAGIVVGRVGDLQGQRRGGQWMRQQARGGVFHFTKRDDAIVLADNPSLRSNKLTISVWVNPDSDPQSSYRGILAKSTSGSWSRGYGLARYPGSPDVHFFVNYYGAETAHAPIPDNSWTHLVGTYDEQTLTLYVNGVKAAEAITRGNYGGPIQHGDSPLLIGQAPDGYGWMGKIDEVMLFNRVLSAEDIKRLYQQTNVDLSTRLDNIPNCISKDSRKVSFGRGKELIISE